MYLTGKRSHIIFYLLTVMIFTAPRLLAQPVAQRAQNNDIIPLAGIWKFKLDPFFTGINSNGVQLMPQLPETIILPGSTDEGGKGYKTQDMTSLRLTRVFEYKGPAWYEKEIFIPADWRNKDVRLFLERAHWQTSVWVNDRPAGSRESLSTPHVYDLSALVIPGKKNSIRIRVDNNMIYDIGYSHAMSAETQTNWNGIIGRIELQAFSSLRVEEIQAYPQVESHLAKLHITVLNKWHRPVKGIVRLACKAINTEDHQMIDPIEVPFAGGDSLIFVNTEMALGKDPREWDEFNPCLYELTATLQTDNNEEENSDATVITFGLRTIKTGGTRFVINGRPSFIRGTVNSAEFPLTGYPAMDMNAWMRIFQTCREYGLNAMRFHSWCPPEAAFAAADKIGIYLQVENSDWRFTVGKDSAVNAFLTQEADRILKVYGNHPSFMMFCEGNELVGPRVNDFLSSLINRWKDDPRHLYTGSSGYPVVPENQFNDFYGARPQRWKEGLAGRFNAWPLNTNYDYADYVARFQVPMITHEIGQWCVYPDYTQLSKYNGVLKPFNYEIFRESLREHHMIGMAARFTEASGRFQVILKKEEIESYLRTPGLGGYHLLQLNDFPGQGTAPVGVVDVFWDPKSYTTAAEFRQFQGDRVLLLKTGSFTWTNDQSFTGDIAFANFGAAAIRNAGIRWSLKYPDGRSYAQGKFSKKLIPLGSPVSLDKLNIGLNRISEATMLTLTVELEGSSCYNQWHIWVYPKQLPAIDMKGVLVAGAWNNEVKDYLVKGGNVLLLADTSSIDSNADPVFSGISWNTVWSGMPPNLLGILCDTAHPAFHFFPTAFHSDWQWWDIVRHSKPMVMDDAPPSFLPLVQMIPDWNNNRKTGLLAEAKVGKGKLLWTSIDLKNNMAERPVARQMLYSLEKYINSADFTPTGEMPVEEISRFFKNRK
jgi:Glycosyl hydrolases family 2, sugar binding domain